MNDINKKAADERSRMVRGILQRYDYINIESEVIITFKALEPFMSHEHIQSLYEEADEWAQDLSSKYEQFY